MADIARCTSVAHVLKRVAGLVAVVHPGSRGAIRGRLTDAREWGSKTERDMKAGRYFSAAKLKTLGELFDKYAIAAAPRLKSWSEVKRQLDW